MHIALLLYQVYHEEMKEFNNHTMSKLGIFITAEFRLDKFVYACIIVYNETRKQVYGQEEAYAGNIKPYELTGAEVL